MFVISIISPMKHSQTYSHCKKVSSLALHRDLIPLVLLAQRHYRITLYQSPPLVDNVSLFWEDKRETGVSPVIWL